jgi:hypothetical protein
MLTCIRQVRTCISARDVGKHTEIVHTSTPYYPKDLTQNVSSRNLSTLDATAMHDIAPRAS